MRVADVFAALRLDTSEFKKGLQSLNGEVNTAARDWGRTMTRFGRNTQRLGRTMTTNVTLPLLGVGAATSKLALDFDTSLRQIVALTDVTAEQIDGIREQILKLGPEVGKGPQELAEAFYFVASAGFQAEEAMQVLTVAAKASAAGMGQTQDVAKVLGSVINAYGHENLSAAEAADILTAAVGKGSAEAADFAAVIGRVAPGASALGVSFDQVTAALAGMTNVGISADEAATSLVQIFSALLKPTTQAEEAMHNLGLSSAGLREELRERGLLATLRTLEERFGNNETAAAAVFGNIRALRGVTALLSVDTGQLNDIFGATADSLGSLQQAYDDTEGPQREIDRAMADLKATAIALGTDVLPTVVDIFKQVAGVARDVAKWWGTLSDETKQSIVQWGLWIAVAGPVILIVGKLASAFGFLFRSIAFLTGPKGLPLLVRSLGTAGLVGALVVVSLALSEASKQVAGFFQEIIHGKQAVDEIRTLADLLGELGDFAGPAAAALRDLGVGADELSHAIDAAGGDVELATRTILENNGDIARSIGELRAAAGGLVDDSSFEEWDRKTQRALRGVGDSITDTALQAQLEAAGIPPAIASELAAGAGEVGGGAADMMAALEEEAVKARQAAVDEMKLMLANIAGLFEDDDTLQQAFQDLLDRMADPYTEAERQADIFSNNTIEIIRGALQSGDPKIVSDTKDLVDNMLGQIEAMEPGALAAGQSVPPAIRDGMDQEIDALIQWINDNTTGPTIDELTIEEADEIGAGNIKRYADGMERNQHLVENAARAARIAALKPLEEGLEPAGRFGGATAASFSSGIGSQSNLTNARNAGASVASAARGAMWWDAYTAGQSIGYSWGAGLSSSFTSVERNLGFRMGEIRALMGGSLPTKGPLTHPYSGGESIAASWGDALVGGLEGFVSQVSSALGMVGNQFALQPAFAGMPKYSAATAGLTRQAADAAPSGGTVIKQWILQVGGVDKVFTSKEDFIKELDKLSAFGDGRLDNG